MGNSKTRISRSISGFNADITTTNDYIMQLCPPPVGQTNASRLGWLPDEITQWQLFGKNWALLYIQYSNKKGARTTNIKDQMKQIIKNCVAYEHKQHLYDRIAISLNATNADFEIFHIKHGTALADTTLTRAAVPGIKEVVIVIKKMGNLFHQLLVTTADKKGRGKPAGVKEILIYMAVTGPKDAAPALADYQYYGDVSRGLLTVTHDDADVGNRAWYIARIKNSRGEIGVASAAVSAIII